MRKDYHTGNVSLGYPKTRILYDIQDDERLQPMSASHKAVLKGHLAGLSPDFRVAL